MVGGSLCGAGAMTGHIKVTGESGESGGLAQLRVLVVHFLVNVFKQIDSDIDSQISREELSSYLKQQVI